MRKFLIGGGLFVFWVAIAFGQSAPRALLDQYCVTCHNEKLKTAGLTLDKMDPSHVAADSEAWEKVVRKLRAGMMQPQGMPRQHAADYGRVTLALAAATHR